MGLISKTDSQSNQLYYLADGLGSTTGLTDGQGSVVGTYSYDVFGAIRSETGGQANDYRFTGQQLDVASDLYYLRARYYDPAIGRFPTRDSFRGWLAGPQSQNPYAYVMNNPALSVDPMGLFGWGDVANAAGSVGDALGGAAENIGDAVGDLGLDDLGYVDLNGTVCLGLCLTGGLQASFGEGFHPYVGTGLGLQASGSATVAPGQHITTGWNCGLQYTPFEGVSPTVQVGTAGYQVDKEGRFRQTVFGEAGVSVDVGLPASYTCIYIF